jgi:hypothetical protein
MEDLILHNKGNNTDSEFEQLKEYNKSKIKSEPTHKIKKIKKKDEY